MRERCLNSSPKLSHVKILPDFTISLLGYVGLILRPQSCARLAPASVDRIKILD